jgi:hypothetical protein
LPLVLLGNLILKRGEALGSGVGRALGSGLSLEYSHRKDVSLSLAMIQAI